MEKAGNTEKMCYCDTIPWQGGVRSMKRLFIVGSGGFGREVLWLVRRINEDSLKKGKARLWEIGGFIDDDQKMYGTYQDDCRVVGGCEYLKELKEDVWVVVSIGSAKVKKSVVEKLEKFSNIHFAVLIDPSSVISDRVEIGEGSIICAGNVLTVDIQIGKHVILNLDCTVGHDVVIEDYVMVYPGVHISGNVHIGESAELGTGMQVIQGKKIGKQGIIGAGAVVVKDIPEKCTAVGSPAKPIKFFE